jgi:hypothetical protein
LECGQELQEGDEPCPLIYRSEHNRATTRLWQSAGLGYALDVDWSHGNCRCTPVGPKGAETTDAQRRGPTVIRKLKSGEYRLYSRKKNPKTGKRRNLGTFKSRAAAEKHERAVQYFKHGG